MPGIAMSLQPSICRSFVLDSPVIPETEPTCPPADIPYRCPAMPRFRVLLALLLAATWCSAAWHVELEAIGLVLNHEHRAHGGHEHHDHPAALEDHHEPVFARNLTKDAQFRIGVTSAHSSTLLTGISGSNTDSARRASLADGAAPPGANPADPPWAQVWQFVWRCAPDSAAPPALG
jgi:hypothetical protein